MDRHQIKQFAKAAVYIIILMLLVPAVLTSAYCFALMLCTPLSPWGRVARGCVGASLVAVNTGTIMALNYYIPIARTLGTAGVFVYWTGWLCLLAPFVPAVAASIALAMGFEIPTSGGGWDWD